MATPVVLGTPTSWPEDSQTVHYYSATMPVMTCAKPDGLAKRPRFALVIVV